MCCYLALFAWGPREIQARCRNQVYVLQEPNENPANGIYLVFDFAEKVLQPHLVRPPGQKHFVTGLKLDFFGESSSNLKQPFIFGFPEGHWPGGKTASEVGSMVSYALELHKTSAVLVNCRTLYLHADNCSRQNKNKYMPWYFSWRFLMGCEETIVIYFLVAGHTKTTIGYLEWSNRSSNSGMC